MSQGAGVRGPSRRKRQDIVAAAFRLFLDRGFAATTIEDVAAEAGVSKQTVYAHFGTGCEGVKDALFQQMVEAQVGQRDEPAHPLAATMATTDDLATDLRTFARWHLHLVMTPDLLRLRRMLIGEAARFPKLARSWYTNGPAQSFGMFAEWFTALHERGLLHIPDPMLAAQTFNWLVLSTPLNEAMALGDSPPTAADLDSYADEAVRVFLAAYAGATHAAPDC